MPGTRPGKDLALLTSKEEITAFARPDCGILPTTDRKGASRTIIMSTYSATENSSSKHPCDWGRAMAVAMTRLVEQARPNDPTNKHEYLYGSRLDLIITEAERGVEITLQWDADEPAPLQS